MLENFSSTLFLLLNMKEQEFTAKEKFEVVSGTAFFDVAQDKPPLFTNFRGGIFLEKCVRTNSRILHSN